MEIADTLDFLLGRWTLERFLTDHRSGTEGRFEGCLTVARAPSDQGARASYDEAGTMCFGGHEGPASRRLQLVRLDSAVVMAHFTDGKPFVDLDLRRGTWTSTHPCRADHYEFFTIVRSPDEVEELWRVRGPAKDYDAVATLKRIG
jgi:hypothetical protein